MMSMMSKGFRLWRLWPLAVSGVVVLSGGCGGGNGSGGPSATPRPTATPTLLPNSSGLTVLLRNSQGQSVNGVVNVAGRSQATGGGQTTFNGLTPGVLLVQATANGQSVTTQIELRLGETFLLPITLPITPTPSPNATDVPPPAVFDLRGRVLRGTSAVAGATVAVVGASGAATGSERTLSGADGAYSFFLGAGRYTLTATSGALTVSRTVTIARDGSAVDNFDLNL